MTMNKLQKKIDLYKKIRVMGVDDSPFNKKEDSIVNIAGIICSDTRFEGMLWNKVTRDGSDATEVIATMLCRSKFHDQVDVVLLDGIAVGGFNIIALPDLYAYTNKPCIAVMRKQPNLHLINRALNKFADSEKRIKAIQQAGAIYHIDNFIFQVHGCDEHLAAKVLRQVTDTGHVPEALRLAHIIGSAIKTGVSSNRA